MNNKQEEICEKCGQTEEEHKFDPINPNTFVCKEFKPKEKKLKILDVKVLNENTPETFQKLLKEGATNNADTSKEETLSEKEMKIFNENGFYTRDVKEKVQNAQRKLKGAVREIPVPIGWSMNKVHGEMLERINKIFKEEFGEKFK